MPRLDCMSSVQALSVPIQTPQYEFQNTTFVFQEAFTSILRKALCCKKEKGDQVDDRFVRSVLEEAEEEEDGDNGDDEFF